MTANTSHIVNPQIYVACLASYNNGKLHGEWINASQSSSDIRAQIAAMLSQSPEPFAEEWAVHDFEGFGEINLGEWPDLETVSTLAHLIEEHGDAFSIWYQHQDGSSFDISELEEKFLEQWQGAFDSENDFVFQLLEDTGQLSEIPAWAQNYFDYDSFARDLRLSGDYSFIRHQSQTYIFSNI